MSQSHTRQVVEFIHSVNSATMPDTLLHQAQRGVTDTLGAILLGSREKLGSILLQFAMEDGARERSLIIGSQTRTSPHMAALVNGAAAHSMEFDDACSAGHISAIMVPTVLAVAEDIGASGRDTLTAYALGYEIATKVGATLLGENFRHHIRGWHSTVANGVMGAAAASAWLLKLDREQTACALGMTGTFAAGMRKNFGTMTKPFHCGHAAHGGILAASLASKGYTASTEILDAPIGYFDVLAEGDYDPSPLDRLGGPWSLLEPGLSIKLYPCCYLASRAADAVLREEGGLAVDVKDITAIHIHMPEFEANTLVYDRPRSGLEGKFSAPYVVAASLLDRRLTPETFRDDKVQRTEIAQLLEKTHKLPFTGNGPVTVELTLADGTTLTRHCQEAYGSNTRPLSDSEVTDKYQLCAKGILSAEAIEKSLALLSDVATLDNIGELTSAMSSGLAT